MHIVIVPGNGSADVAHANWYAWAQTKLNAIDGISCDLRNMPDPTVAKESVWLPFMREQLKCDEGTILIGHSSGAQAAMRFAEKYRVKGIILVSACVTDLGDPGEKASGYYDRPWEWDSIRSNTDFQVQFGSSDYPLIPWIEHQQVADGLRTQLIKFTDRGHFMEPTFPELISVVKQKIS